MWTDNVASITFPLSYKLPHINMIGKRWTVVGRNKTMKEKCLIADSAGIIGKTLFFPSSLLAVPPSLSTDSHHFYITSIKLKHNMRPGYK